MICRAINRCKCATDGSNTECLAKLLGTIGRARSRGARNRADRRSPAVAGSLQSSTAHQKDMGRLNVGIEFHVISTAAPGVCRAAQQVLYLIDVALHLPETLNRNVDKRILFAMRIKIHNDQNDVITRSRSSCCKTEWRRCRRRGTANSCKAAARGFPFGFYLVGRSSP